MVFKLADLIGTYHSIILEDETACNDCNLTQYHQLKY